MKIHLTPQEERPRERCLKQGSQSLSLRECLALILGSGPRHKGCLGVAADILSRAGHGFSVEEEERAFFTALESSGQSALHSISGLGPAGRSKVLAAFELGRRYAFYREKNQNKEKFVPRTTVILKKIPETFFKNTKEALGFIPVHRPQRLGDFCVVAQGARTFVNVDPAELFAQVLSLRPLGFYLFHNHPSGDLTPSPEDERLTQRVEDIGHSLGVPLLGHWIVGPQGQAVLLD